MENSLVIATIAGLGAMLGWGFADFFAKKTIDKSDDLTTLFWSQYIGVIPVLIIFLFTFNIPKLSGFQFASLVPFGVVSALSYLLLYRGFGKGKISLLSPIFASYAAVVVLLSALFFHESIPLHQGLAIAIVFIGLLLANGDPREIRTLLNTPGTKVAGIGEVGGAMLIYSLWLVLLDRLLIGHSWVFIILVIRTFSVITLLFYAIAKGHSLVVRDKSLWKFLVAIGLFDVAAYSFVAYGFSHTSNLSVVAVLSAAFSVPTIILAHIFLKERATRLQILATVVIIIGIVLVSLA
jgi:drug/metabolite transporter (DMT)-like permease